MTNMNSATKKLVFSAMAIALALVTSYIKIIKLPMGGSVTLFSMFFICLIGYWYGPKIGIITGMAYGLLQLVIDPYILSIPQVIVDYPLAFGALGFSGFFSNQKHGLQIGYFVGVLGRYVFAILSGVIFFGTYAADYNMNPLVYSAIYNGSYLGLEAAITVVLLLIPAVSGALTKVKTLVIAEA